MTDVLEYAFQLWSIAERVTVQLPAGDSTSEEFAFLDYVVQRFSSLEYAWMEYRKLAPKRGAFFDRQSRAAFDNLVTMHRQHFPPEPLPANVVVTAIPADELKAHERNRLLKAKRSGARDVHGAVQGVLREVVPRLDSVAFKAKSGMEALRIGTVLEPVGSGERPERRPKRTLPHGLTMPSAQPVKTLRKLAMAEIRSRVDLSYIVKSAVGGFRIDGQLPLPGELVGMVFDLLAQLKLSLELDSKQRRLVPAADRKTTDIQFRVLLGEDGITPAVSSVVCVGIRLLDPDRLLFAAGHSRFLRLLVACLPESGIRDVAAFRNHALSQFLNSR